MKMQIVVWNPQKGRNEAIDVVFTEENTTWFDECEDSDGIFSITDLPGGILIREANYTSPLYLYDISREDICHDHGRARTIHTQYRDEVYYERPSET
jgi:hypothetical protein